MEVVGLLLLGSGAAALACAIRARPAPPRPAPRSVAAPSVPALPVAEIAPPDVAKTLARAGVRTVRDLLEVDEVPAVAATTLRDLRRLAGLLAVPNVGREEAALLVAAGVEMADDLLREPPAALAARLNALNAEARFVPGEIAPGEVRQWAESVRRRRADTPSAGPRVLSQPSIGRHREEGPAGVA